MRIMRSDFVRGGGLSRPLLVETLEERRVLAVAFDFNYQQSGNIGFNDPNLGAERRDALERAASELGALFDHTATIEVDVISSNSSGLAAASARFASNPPLSGGFFAGVPQQKIQNGGDPNAAASDATVTVFFGNTTWHTGDSSAPAGAFDMVAIMKHELLHTLGFSTGVNRNGADQWGNALGSAGSIWQPFDEFLADRTGTSIIDASNFQIDLASWQVNSVGGTSPANGLFFNGPNAMAANGGQLVGLYSPGTWQEGSSASHLDTNSSSFSDQTHLMVHSFRSGLVNRNVHPLEIAMLEDLGYDMTLDPPAPDAGFSISQTALTVTEGTQTTFTAVLDAAPNGIVQLSVVSADATEAQVNPGQLTFTSQNWNLPQAITVTGVADGTLDGDQTTSITVSVNDAVSDDAFDLVPDQSLQVTVLDDDAPSFTVSPTSPATVSETGTSSTFSVQLTSAPTTDVVLQVVNPDPTEVTVDRTQFTFTPSNWNAPQTLTVTGVADAIVDGNQTTQLEISVDAVASDDAFDSAPTQFVTIVTADIDSPGFSGFQLSGPGEIQVSESGSSATLSVQLEAAPSSPVIVGVQTSDASEVALTPFNLIFTAANWNIAQTVTVTGQDDLVVDGNQLSTATFRVDTSNSDPMFAGVPEQTVNVTTLDDEVASFTVLGPAASVISESETTSFTVELDDIPESTVVITLAVNDQDSVSLNTGSIAFTPATWNLPRSITVSGIEDSVADGDQQVTITASIDTANSSDAYGQVPPQTLQLLVTDIDGSPPSNLDFGDAGGVFPTTLAQDGARHVAVGPILGAQRDTEADAPASGGTDDATGNDDEDGVSVSPVFLGQAEFSVVVTAGSTTGTVRLDAWVDFDADGAWEPVEQIASSVSLAAGDNTLTIPVPEGVQLGARQARFRVSTIGGLAPTGLATDGEVEDHLIEFTNSDWFNVSEPLNVDGVNGAAPTPFDALAIVNDLTANIYSDPITFELPQNENPPVFIDVDNNGRVNPLDALLVINALPANGASSSAVKAVPSHIYTRPHEVSLAATARVTSPGLDAYSTSEAPARSAHKDTLLANPRTAALSSLHRNAQRKTAATDRCFAEFELDADAFYSAFVR